MTIRLLAGCLCKYCLYKAAFMHNGSGATTQRKTNKRAAPCVTLCLKR